MIPKKIHYIWLGSNPKSKLTEICLLTWKEKMPDYEIIEWNEKNLDLDKIAEENEFFAECKKRKLYAFMADYLRIKILYEQGGIYIDTDVQAIKRMDDLLNTNLILGYENCTIDSEINQIGTGLIGAEKGNEFIKKVYDFYNNEIMNSELYIIPTIITKIYNELNDKEKAEIKIFPTEYFSPYDSGGTKTFDSSMVTENTYAIHWFSYSWGNFDSRKFLSVKHIKNPIKRKIAEIQSQIDFNKEQKIKKQKYESNIKKRTEEK